MNKYLNMGNYWYSPWEIVNPTPCAEYSIHALPGRRSLRNSRSKSGYLVAACEKARSGFVGRCGRSVAGLRKHVVSARDSESIYYIYKCICLSLLFVVVSLLVIYIVIFIIIIIIMIMIVVIVLVIVIVMYGLSPASRSCEADGDETWQGELICIYIYIYMTPLEPTPPMMPPRSKFLLH